MNKLYKAVMNLKFEPTGFVKFINSSDPLYADYHDRQSEKWHDIGYNNGIDAVLTLLGGMGLLTSKDEEDVQNSRDDS